MKRGLLSALLVHLLFALPVLAFNSGHIQGYVLDQDGLPLQGAMVTVSGDGAVGTWRCAADRDGFYRIAGLEASRPLTVTVEAPGRISVSRTGYRVRDDRTLHLDFILRTEKNRSILVILDAGVPYHIEAMRGSLRTMPGHARVFEATDDTPATVRRLRETLAGRPDGIIAIGPLAARLARSTTFDIPVVHVLVPDPVHLGLEVANMCGVPANGAFDQQLDLLRESFPHVSRLGVLYVPGRLAGALGELSEAGAARGIHVVARPLHAVADADRQLASMARDGIDGFLLLLDPDLWSPAVIGAVGRFARQEGIVLVTPDQDLAASTGGVSYAPDVEELGAFAGGILDSILHRRTSVAQVGLVYPPAGIHDPGREERERIEAVREIMQARAETAAPGGP